MNGKLSSKNSFWKWISYAEEQNDEMGIQTLAIDLDWIIYMMDLWACKKLTLHFTNQLVNVALKFYVVNLTSSNLNF